MRAEGDQRLAGMRYDWLRNPVTTGGPLPPYAAGELKTARAWALKETALSLYH